MESDDGVSNMVVEKYTTCEADPTSVLGEPMVYREGHLGALNMVPCVTTVTGNSVLVTFVWFGTNSTRKLVSRSWVWVTVT